MSALQSRGVFISYRREDTGPYARLLKDHLAERLPGHPVFIDLDEIEVGLDFAEVIKTALDSCAVMVALIGPKWLTLTDEGGRRRLDDPDDYVRFEVRTGLRRCTRLIPVLADGAKPLRQHDLPDDIQKLARLNALIMSYDHFEYDEGRLTETIRKVLQPRTASPEEQATETSATATNYAAAVPATGSGIAYADSGGGFDPAHPSAARTYDYFLDGRNHFAADREVADKVLEGWPTIRIGVRENRKFLARVVRDLAREAGIRQFLDIGTGLPTADNTHEVAQAVAPSARVVYADNDPLVLAHARALLTSSPEGRTAYIHADLRDLVAILNDPVTREVLDFTRPIALMLVAILHMIPDEEKPAKILATLLDAMPSGSYIVASHITGEHNAGAADGERTFQQGGIAAQWRDADVFARLAFNGLELVPPGVVLISEWRNDDPGPRLTPADVSCYGGVGRKP